MWFVALAFIYVSMLPEVAGRVTWVSNSSGLEEKFDFGETVPLRKHLGVQWLNDTVIRPVVPFTEQDKERFCFHYEERFEEFAQKFNEKIVLIRFPAFDDKYPFNCLGGSEYYREVDYLNQWCRLNSTFVFFEDRQPGIFANDHDGDYYVDFILTNPRILSCIVLEARDSPVFDQFLEFYAGTVNTSEFPLLANLTIDRNECIEFFESSLIQFWMRGILGGGFLVVGMTSLVFLFDWGSRKSPNKLVSTTVLLVTSATTLPIGLVLLGGGWRISDGINIDINNAMNPVWFGTQVANDILIATRWNEIKHEMLIRNRARGTGFLRSVKRYVVVGFAVVLVILDFVASYMMISITARTETLLLVFAMVAIMKQLYKLERAKKSGGDKAKLNLQSHMIRKLKLWIFVSICAAIMTMSALLVGGLNQIVLATCEGWVTIWSLILAGKLGNLLANIMVISNGRSGLQSNGDTTVAPGDQNDEGERRIRDTDDIGEEEEILYLLLRGQ